MTQTSWRFLPIGRIIRSVNYRSRRVSRPQVVETLESRALCTIVGLTANASPMILRPINPMNQPHPVQISRIRPVTIAGNVSVTGDVPPAISFQVVDEFGRHEPSGTIRIQLFNPAIDPGTFFFTKRIGLNLTRRAGDPNGRQYTIIVTAQDQQGTQTTTIPVTTLPLKFIPRR